MLKTYGFLFLWICINPACYIGDTTDLELLSLPKYINGLVQDCSISIVNAL